MQRQKRSIGTAELDMLREDLAVLTVSALRPMEEALLFRSVKEQKLSLLA